MSAISLNASLCYFHYFACCMTELRLKLRIIFIPFILVLVSVMLLFCVVKWYIEVKHKIELLDEWNFDFILCSLITSLLLWLTMRRRIKILHRDTTTFFNNISFLNVASLFVIIIPTNYAINYVSNAYSPIQYATSAKEIINRPHTRYYNIENAIPDTAHKRVSFESYTSGKRHQVLTFTCKAVYPLRTLQDNAVVEHVWYCRFFEHSISNSSNDEVIKVEEDAFKKDCYSVLDKVPADSKRNSIYENQPDNYFRSIFSDIIPMGIQDIEDVLILMPMEETIASRSAKDLRYCLLALAIGIPIYFALVMLMPIDKKNLEDYQQDKIPMMDEKNGFWILYPYRYHPLAILFYIMLICAAAWVVLHIV